MNYELAKQLKEAGFPYDPANEIYDGDETTYPTLSELIEACGESFCDLSQWGNSWWARPFMHAVRGKLNDKENAIDFLGEGSTPKEAVARLWLALNRPEEKE